LGPGGSGCVVGPLGPVVAPPASEWRGVGPPGAAVESPAPGRNENPGGVGAPVAVWAWNMSKSLVRHDKTAKGKFVSSKITCWEMMMLLVKRSRHR
jgi:hypothetical protein